MSTLDPQLRSQRGAQQQAELRGAATREPRTLLEAAWRDFVYAEVWTRPGLDRRSRFLIAIAGSACEGGAAEIIDGYVRGALTLNELSVAELREAALHLAVYAGWTRGTAIDAAVTRVVAELGLHEDASPAIRAKPWDSQQRLDEGGANFRKVMVIPSPPPVTPYFEGGILNFVFGEMWTRPGLDQRARRWLTLVGVADSASSTPIRSHTWSAMQSGDATPAEMQEFVLQYAIHGGWPKGSVMQGAVLEMSKRVAQGLSYE